MSGEGSIEPSYEDLLLIIRGVGFTILVSSFSVARFHLRNRNTEGRIRIEKLKKLRIFKTFNKSKRLNFNKSNTLKKS